MARLTLESERFGSIETRDEDVLHFDGLPGFADARRFVLVRHDRASPFGWMICVDDPELGFVVTDPRQFFPTYPENPAPELRRAVGEVGDGPLELLCIVQVSEGTPTLNLLAPLVIHPETRRGAQVILEQGNHALRASLPELDAKED